MIQITQLRLVDADVALLVVGKEDIGFFRDPIEKNG
jgi:hypothetical protein